MLLICDNLFFAQALGGESEIDFQKFKLVLARHPNEFGKFNHWLYLFEQVCRCVYACVSKYVKTKTKCNTRTRKWARLCLTKQKKNAAQGQENRHAQERRLV